MDTLVKGLSKPQTEYQQVLPFVYKNKHIELVHIAKASNLPYDALNNLKLSHLDFLILNLVGRHLVLTHAITHSLLKKEDIGIQEIIRSYRKLMVLELVEGYRWHREGDIYESPWAYTLSKNGLYFLKTRNNTEKFYTVLSNQFVQDNLHLFLGTLITNAFVLYMQKLNIHKHSVIRPLLKWEEVGERKQFMPQALMNLLHLRTQREFTLLIEPIRRNENWKKEIDNKLKKYSFFYINESYKKCELIRGKPITLLIVEDTKHMQELGEYLALTPHENFFKKNKVLITTDWSIRDIEELNLHKGVYTIVFEDDQANPKYRYVNLLD